MGCGSWQRRAFIASDATAGSLADNIPVYNLTDFAADHPGGIDVIVECAGDDATEPFDYAGHTPEALTTMAKFQVGTLEGHVEDTDSATVPVLDAAQSGTIQGGSLASAGPPILKASLGIIVLGGLALYANRLQLPSPAFGKLGATQSLSDALSDVTSGVGGLRGFAGGLLISSAFYLVGYGFLYYKAYKTLEHEKDVFSYPSVIPRKRL